MLFLNENMFLEISKDVFAVVPFFAFFLGRASASRVILNHDEFERSRSY